MKINFDGKGDDFIEIKNNNDKIVIIISAVDIKNPLRTIINSAEITQEQFAALIKEVNPSSVPIEKTE